MDGIWSGGGDLNNRQGEWGMCNPEAYNHMNFLVQVLVGQGLKQNLMGHQCQLQHLSQDCPQGLASEPLRRFQVRYLLGLHHQKFVWEENLLLDSHSDCWHTWTTVGKVQVLVGC